MLAHDAMQLRIATGNPYHGKDGKFSSGDTVPSGYKSTTNGAQDASGAVPYRNSHGATIHDYGKGVTVHWLGGSNHHIVKVNGKQILTQSDRVLAHEFARKHLKGL